MDHGDGTFSLPLGYAVGSTPSAVAEGDFNNDSFVDLAVTNNKASTVSVLLGNGNGTFNTATNFPTGAGPLSVVVQDLNGDGKADLAVASAVSRLERRMGYPFWQETGMEPFRLTSTMLRSFWRERSPRP